MTKFPELFAALAAPFDPNEVKSRQQAGRTLYYITARTAMNRLDAVLGPEGWWDSYLPMEHSVLCTLTIRLPDGTTLAKQDAGGYAGMSDQGDDDKSGYSDSFKRACVKFGTGRYLYRDGVPEFVREQVAVVVPESAEAPDDPPPGPRRPLYAETPPPEGERKPFADKPPRSGRGLFAWIKDVESRHEIALLQFMNKWGKLNEFPGRMVDWDEDMVARAYQEAMREIRASEAEVDAQAARDAG
jgi:hypothetical protein